MAIKEGKWRCPACAAVNAGRDMKCGSCGAVRGPQVKFFLEEDALEVSDEALLGTATGGADWHCDFCGTDNRAAAAACRQCGAPRAGMKERATGLVGQDLPQKGGSRPPAPVPRRKPAVLIAVAALVLVAVAAVFLLTRGTEDKLRLQGGEWSRTIQVEHQELVRREAWIDQVPAGGRVLRTWEAQRSTERVQVGTEKVKTGTKDLGNGFFQDVIEERPVFKDRPIFGTKAEYQILEWKPYREALSKGGFTDKPVWADPALVPGDREGARVERAILRFVSTDPARQDQVLLYNGAKAEDFAAFSLDREYPATVRGDRVLKLNDEAKQR